jgi:hypothetical protein
VGLDGASDGVGSPDAQPDGSDQELAQEA